jgi:hypothetical protein
METQKRLVELSYSTKEICSCCGCECEEAEYLKVADDLSDDNEPFCKVCAENIRAEE